MTFDNMALSTTREFILAALIDFQSQFYFAANAAADRCYFYCC